MNEAIKWFRAIRLGDVPLVGGKTASLGELYGELGAAGVRVPNGFAITADAYRALLDGSGLRDRLAAARSRRVLTGASLWHLPRVAPACDDPIPRCLRLRQRNHHMAR